MLVDSVSPRKRRATDELGELDDDDMPPLDKNDMILDHGVPGELDVPSRRTMYLPTIDEGHTPDSRRSSFMTVVDGVPSPPDSESYQAVHAVQTELVSKMSAVIQQQRLEAEHVAALASRQAETELAANGLVRELRGFLQQMKDDQAMWAQRTQVTENSCNASKKKFCLKNNNR